MTAEEWLELQAQKLRQATGANNLYGMGPSTQPTPPPGTQQQLAQYARQNISTPSSLPTPAQPPQQMPPQMQLDASHPAVRQFPQIQQKLARQEPLDTSDIRAMTSPTQALSEDQEAEINKNLHGEDEDDDAHDVNNKAGGAEGNYSGS